MLVDRKDEIRRKELYDGSFTYCYMVAFKDTFDSPLSKECRGLIISKTDKVLRRPLSKFFNANERPETQAAVLDRKTIKSVYEKVDGSMIAPWIDELGDLHFDTKKLNMDMRTKIDEFVPENIVGFTGRMFSEHLQPIFELYHPDIPETNIVIQYNEPTWRLLAIRNLETGDYLDDEEVDDFAIMYNIRRPKRYRELENKTTSEIIEAVQEFVNEEGVIVRYTDGTLTKIKCPWYLERHHVVNLFQHRHKIAKLVLEEGAIDDLASVMTPKRVTQLDEFSEELHKGLTNVKEYVMLVASQFNTKKDFGLSDESKGTFSNLIFRLIGRETEDSEVFEMVKNFVAQHYVSKKTHFETLETNEVWRTK